jgi:hypothetical protein
MNYFEFYHGFDDNDTRAEQSDHESETQEAFLEGSLPGVHLCSAHGTPCARGGPCLGAREAADHLRANAGGTLVCHRAYWAGTAQVPRQALGKVGAQRLIPPMVQPGPAR